MKKIRFLPLVALAAFSLLGLKMAALFLGEGFLPLGTSSTLAKTETATKANGKTGKKQAAKAKVGKKDKNSLAAKRIGAKKTAVPKDITNLEGDHYHSKSEVLLLASLSKRRVELDKRESDMALQLNLVKAVEKRINDRIKVLKTLEKKIQSFSKQQKQRKKNQYNRLVKMYAAMKPKGAARIFNELDQKVLLGIIKNMKPQAMSAILAAMQPAKAREITMALAGNVQKQFTAENLDQLPKINGQ